MWYLETRNNLLSCDTHFVHIRVWVVWHCWGRRHLNGNIPLISTERLIISIRFNVNPYWANICYLTHTHIHIHRSDETAVSCSNIQQKTYLVFESALLSLFALCTYCRSHISIKKVAIGSFLGIIQNCGHCGKKYIWESQPVIGNIPAGNILTSAAILYAGALPVKSLRMFKVLNLVTITKKPSSVIRVHFCSLQFIHYGSVIKSNFLNNWRKIRKHWSLRVMEELTVRDTVLSTAPTPL